MEAMIDTHSLNPSTTDVEAPDKKSNCETSTNLITQSQREPKKSDRECWTAPTAHNTQSVHSNSTMKRPYGSWKLPVVILIVTASPIGASTQAASPTSSSLSTSSPLPSRLNTSARHQRRQDFERCSLSDHDQRESITRSLDEGSGRRRLSSVLFGCSPAVLASTTSYGRSPPHNNDDDGVTLYSHSQHSTVPVSAIKQAMKIPPLILSKLREQDPPKNTGYYYGLQPDKLFPYDSSRHRANLEQEQQQIAMASALTETLEEMKSMRQELQILRRDMYEMRKKITGEKDLEFSSSPVEERNPEAVRLAREKRLEQLEKMGNDVELWARKKLFEEDRAGNGWTEVLCNKMLAKSVNPDGRTTCYIGWMKDSRGENAVPGDERDYPAVKVFSTIDGPLGDVCTYLSRQEHMTDYNGILTEQKELEIISPHSKICVAKSPQVLFVKPREFVSFLYHRWLRDGSVVMINQAVEHKDAPPEKEEGKGKACRAYALRGATFISPDPDDPQKTRFAMIAHAAPGGGLPHWVRSKMLLSFVCALHDRCSCTPFFADDKNRNECCRTY